MVRKLLSQAAQQEILAFKNSDPSYLYSVYAGDLFQGIENEIFSLDNQGIYRVPFIDTQKSAYRDIRRISNTYIEVDTCEYWSYTDFRKADNQPVSLSPMRLVAQTLTIQFFEAGYRITNAQIMNGPAFCS